MTATSLLSAPHLRALQRDNEWLAEHLECVWQRHFGDTPRINPVDIAFAKRWKARLGSISYCVEGGSSSIRINSLLSHPVVPECLTTVTVAHELVHYSHGFGSQLPQLYDDPHEDNVVEKELLARGLGEDYHEYLFWIENHWDRFYRLLTHPPRALWLPRKSGEPVRLHEHVFVAREAAASVTHPRPAAEVVNQQANLN
jgi:hypothetical protein